MVEIAGKFGKYSVLLLNVGFHFIGVFTKMGKILEAFVLFFIRHTWNAIVNRMLILLLRTGITGPVFRV